VHVFDALADPTRRRIVELLAKRERSTGELAGHFELSQPAVSKHLRVLREAGVVDVRGVAQRRLYRLDPATLSRAEAWIARNRRFWEERLDALEDQVQREESG
jgi:DNA-binding transcriptional ArsR family regulator